METEGTHRKKHCRRLLLLLLFELAIIMPGSIYLILINSRLTTLYRDILAGKLEAETEMTASRLRNSVISRISTPLYLESLIMLHPETTQDEFKKFAETVFEYNSSIRALELTNSETQVIYVHPDTGNKRSSNPIVLKDDPLRGPYVRKAIETRQMTIQQPFELRQGGLGIIARNPVFIDDRFIGLAIAVLDVPDLIAEGFPEKLHGDFLLKIYDSDGKLFLGDFDDSIPHETKTVSFADSTWTIKMAYNVIASDRSFNLSRNLIFIFGFGFLFLLSVIIWILWNSEQRLAELVDLKTADLQHSETRLRSIIRNADAGFFSLDADGRLNGVNKAWLEMYGLESLTDAAGRDYIEFHREQEKTAFDEMLRMIKSGKPASSMEFSRQMPDGSIGYHILTAQPVIYEERVEGIEGFLFDITERKKTEEQKDQLMKELNHRVKNNLMIISSLISLKENFCEAPAALEDISRQIDTIRIVHEKMYRDNQLRGIQIKDYINDLLQMILASYPGCPEKAVTEIPDDMILSINTTIPLGLILNEIASNAIKFGTKADSEPELRVSLAEDRENGFYVLSVSNNGPPIPDSIDTDNPETLGLKLVAILAGQLYGTVSITKEPHPSFVIRFRPTEAL